VTQLFRTEVLQQKKDRLSGEVAIAVPIAWQVTSFLIFGALLAAIIFMSMASYARVETIAEAPHSHD
jgi:membrane fusion protein